MSLALSTCVLFILLMQSVNRPQLKKKPFIFALFASASAAGVFMTNIFPLVSMYASL